MSSSASPAELNRLKTLWARGETALGAIATIPSIQAVRVMAQSGLDFVIIDLEHGAIDIGAAHAMIVATAGTPMTPLVRVASVAAWHAKAPLDLGALGVCFPMTTTPEAAAAAVSAVRYPPRGERHWGPFHAPLRWGLSMRDYQDRIDDEILAIGTLEHIDALTNVPEIVQTPGLDLLFIGPGDLATSMGLKVQAEHPDVLAAMRAFEDAVLPSSVILGGPATSPDQIRAMKARGYRALVVGFDWSLLQRGIRAVVADQKP
jgi:4-hydroxy-2-oxoheptanedioate aldolase